MMKGPGSKGFGCALIVLVCGSVVFGGTIGIEVEAVATSYDSDLLLDPATGRHLKIEDAVGTGAHTAYLVIDFAETGGYTYAWQWNFDGSPTGWDMVEAVTAATPLDMTFTVYGFGTFVDNFTYAPYGEAGLVSNYWFYHNGLASGTHVEWSGASGGATGRVLADGDLDGWYNGFSGAYARVPVPEPVSGALWLVAGAACLRRQRVAKHA